MNELTAIEVPKPLDIYRQSTDAASVCKEIVLATSTTISGRRFVTVEGWSAIAVAHGVIASAIDVRRITDEGASGFAATGVLKRMSDGVEIGRAEGFVGDDERTWGKRDVYAKRAMAQTRAISRVCRSAFSHVVVMMKAGLATTPAEEVPAHDPDTGEIIDNANGRRDPTIPGITKIRNNINKLRRDGAKATDLEAFNALVHGCKDDLQKIKDADHSLWTGMGEDFDGMKAWIKRRREELAGSLEYQLLVSTLEECTGDDELQSWLTKNGDVVGQLDGEESRKFEALYDAKAEALKTPLEAGAFGG
jgi:hypothetical protein